MGGRSTTVRFLAGVAGVAAGGVIAAGAWQLVSPAEPGRSTPSPANEVPDVSRSSTPPYADDDDSDEAAIRRFRQQHEQWLADQDAHGPDSAVSSSWSGDAVAPTSSSSTIYLVQDDDTSDPATDVVGQP